MSVKIEKEVVDIQTSARRTTRRKPSKYPSDVYGARLPLDDAKILDDYANKHNLERADVVRLGLHQFALRQQMRVRVEESQNQLQEPTLSEQIAPLKTKLDELEAALNNLTTYLSVNYQRSLSTSINSDFDIAQQRGFNNEFAPHFERVFTEQRQMLERILVTATLALRLYVSYSVEPTLSRLTSDKKGELAAYLLAADKGREYWSEATRQVVKRMGNRILLDLNFLQSEQKEQ